MTKEAAIRSIRRRMALTKVAAPWWMGGGLADGMRGKPAGTTATQLYQGAKDMGISGAGLASRAWNGVKGFFGGGSTPPPQAPGLRGVQGAAASARKAWMARQMPTGAAPSPTPQQGMTMQVR